MTNTATEPVVPGSLRDTIRREIDGYLRDPLAFPSEFVSWIPQRVEQVGILSPRSNITGAYTTADTVAELGAAVHGRPCMIRAGQSPYHFAQMTYDDVFGKWVSTTTLATMVVAVTASPTGGFTDLSESASFQRQQIPGFKALYDAGLRPQTHILARGVSDASHTNSIRANILQFNSGDTSLSSFAVGPQLDWVNVTVAQWKVSGTWADMSFISAPTESEAVLALQVNFGVTATFQNLAVLMRWVANPV